MKPQTNEPWVNDAYTYAETNEPVLRGEYNDECVLDSNNGYISSVSASSGHNAGIGKRNPWDDSPWRYTPHALRGMRPVRAAPRALRRALARNVCPSTRDDCVPRQRRQHRC